MINTFIAEKDTVMKTDIFLPVHANANFDNARTAIAKNTIFGSSSHCSPYGASRYHIYKKIAYSGGLFTSTVR